VGQGQFFMIRFSIIVLLVCFALTQIKKSITKNRSREKNLCTHLKKKKRKKEKRRHVMVQKSSPQAGSRKGGLMTV
jgi:hypothetical protein